MMTRQELSITQDDARLAGPGRNTATRHDIEAGGIRDVELKSLRFPENRLREWMLGELLGDRRSANHLILARISEGLDLRHLGFPIGEGSRLVQHHRIDPPRRLKRQTALDEDSPTSCIANRRDHCGRRGENQGARTGNHENCDGSKDLVGGEIRDSEQHQDRRREVLREAIRDSLGGRLAGLRLLHQDDDVRQGRPFARLGSLDLEGASLIEGSFIHPGSRSNLDRDRFPGERRLVHGRLSGEDCAIYGDALPGLDENDVAEHDVLDRQDDVLPVSADSCGLWLQIHEPADGVPGLRHGDVLQ